MADPQKLVLMLQSNRLQGLIWQAVLKSQRLTVIWESSKLDLSENLDQLLMAGLDLPDLLLIDRNLPNFDPYSFCRWCRERHPQVKIVLVDNTQQKISSYEHRWAVYQGAADLLPVLQVDNLVTSVAAAVRRVLLVLNDQPLHNGALITVLLQIKRKLEPRIPGISSNGQRVVTEFSRAQSLAESTIAVPSNGYQAQSNGHSDGTRSNGTHHTSHTNGKYSSHDGRVTNGKGTLPQPSSHRPSAAQPLPQSWVVLPAAPNLPPSPLKQTSVSYRFSSCRPSSAAIDPKTAIPEETERDGKQQANVRRYRGVKY